MKHWKFYEDHDWACPQVNGKYVGEPGMLLYEIECEYCLERALTRVDNNMNHLFEHAYENTVKQFKKVKFNNSFKKLIDSD